MAQKANPWVKKKPPEEPEQPSLFEKTTKPNPWAQRKRSSASGNSATKKTIKKANAGSSQASSSSRARKKKPEPSIFGQSKIRRSRGVTELPKLAERDLVQVDWDVSPIFGGGHKTFTGVICEIRTVRDGAQFATAQDNEGVILDIYTGGEAKIKVLERA